MYDHLSHRCMYFPFKIYMQYAIQLGVVNNVVYGLRTPNEAYFNWNPEVLGLCKQIGQIDYGAFGVTSVPKKRIPSAVVTHYCAWYSFFRGGR